MPGNHSVNNCPTASPVFIFWWINQISVQFQLPFVLRPGSLFLYCYFCRCCYRWAEALATFKLNQINFASLNVYHFQLLFSFFTWIFRTPTRRTRTRARTCRRHGWTSVNGSPAESPAGPKIFGGNGDPVVHEGVFQPDWPALSLSLSLSKLIIKNPDLRSKVAVRIPYGDKSFHLFVPFSLARATQCDIKLWIKSHVHLATHWAGPPPGRTRLKQLTAITATGDKDAGCRTWYLGFWEYCC